jgi:hypothetical protein
MVFELRMGSSRWAASVFAVTCSKSSGEAVCTDYGPTASAMMSSSKEREEGGAVWVEADLGAVIGEPHDGVGFGSIIKEA